MKYSDNHEKLLDLFKIEGKPIVFRRHGNGHINYTYYVETDKGFRYILQGINTYVFRDSEGLMQNFKDVTEFAAGRCSDSRQILQLVPTCDGKSHVYDESGTPWRVTVFVENTFALEQPEQPGDLYRSALCIGRFTQLLSDYPAEHLKETIPDFHNTPQRFRNFRKSIEANRTGKADEVKTEIEFALARECEADKIISMNKQGLIPMRVTHNDAKLSNVLFDADTREGVCLIDLDTIMPGFAVYDFGEAARTGACSAAEDEPDLQKVSLDLEAFREIASGFIQGFPGLTETEIDNLPLGMKLMTLENGIRFLGDHIDGDLYFSIAHPGHNLDRARVQFRTVALIEEHWSELNAIIAEEKKLLRS